MTFASKLFFSERRPAAVTDDESSSSPHILGVVPGRRMGLFCNTNPIGNINGVSVVLHEAAKVNYLHFHLWPLSNPVNDIIDPRHGSIWAFPIW